MDTILADHVDAPASAIWPKLTDPSHQLTPEERAQIAVFIAFLFTRTSKLTRVLQGAFAQLEEMVRTLMDVAEHRADDPSWQPIPATPGVPSYVINSREDLEDLRPTHNDFVMLTSTGIRDVATIILLMNWTFVHAPPGVRFITSDNPVARDNAIVENRFRRSDITRYGAEISVPISKHCCLVCSYHGPEAHVRVGADTVDLINRKTLIWSDVEVYSSRREEWLDQAFFGNPSQ